MVAARLFSAIQGSNLLKHVHARRPGRAKACIGRAKARICASLASWLFTFAGLSSPYRDLSVLYEILGEGFHSIGRSRQGLGIPKFMDDGRGQKACGTSLVF